MQQQWNNGSPFGCIEVPIEDGRDLEAEFLFGLGRRHWVSPVGCLAT
jgi:hypothetical protein